MSLDRRQLVCGRLLRRYKRFLADVELPSGEVITVHCPNTGSMRNCVEAGAEAWLSRSDNPKRKYAYTWELTRTRRGDFIGINTGRANALVADAITAGVVPELAGYDTLRREVKMGDSRVDILLETGDKRCFVEVKSVTLLEPPVSAGQGYFPDAVSERASRHVDELARQVSEGHRAVLMFCVQHSGIRSVAPAAHIDPTYADALRRGAASGVEVLAYKTRFGLSGQRLAKRVPVFPGEER